jgi:hypothetical protein
MHAFTAFELVDDILQSHAQALGADLPAYRNHVTRMLHFVFAIAPALQSASQAILIAGAFHDLGIWTARTFDYLDPSSRLAQDYLRAQGLEPLGPEVALIIGQHHKLRAYTGPFAQSVEAFRRADLVDLSLGLIRAGLSREYVSGRCAGSFRTPTSMPAWWPSPASSFCARRSSRCRCCAGERFGQKIVRRANAWAGVYLTVH